MIKGAAEPSNGDNTSALIIMRDAQIFANGTADAPIVFTAEDDDLSGTLLTKEDRGLWGGVIVLGNATISASDDAGNDVAEFNIEGISAENAKGLYGGSDDADNSGSIRYISIRHGGAEIGAGNEINGLTLGGVGSGTTIEYVEVFANLDDGIEFFGGSVNVKYAVVAYCGDDSYDSDQAYSGKGQFWFMIQDDDSGSGAETDGPEGSAATPVVVVSNATLIGDGMMGGSNSTAVALRDGAAYEWHNSIFQEFSNLFVDIADEESAQNVTDGLTQFANNFWFGFGNEIADGINFNGMDNSGLIQALVDANNQLVDPGLRGVSRDTDNGLDPRLGSGAAAKFAATPLEDDFFEPVSYAGAFNNNNWAAGWTAMSLYNFFGDIPLEEGTVTIRDEDLVGGQKLTTGQQITHMYLMG